MNIKVQKVVSLLICDSIYDYKMLEINVKRRKSMKKIWIWWSFLLLTNIYSLSYSIMVRRYEDRVCRPTVLSQTASDVIKYIDRFVEYQVWVIPLLYVHWPFSRRKDLNITTASSINSST